MQHSTPITDRQIVKISGLSLFIKRDDLATKVLITSKGRCSRVEDLTREEGFILLRALANKKTTDINS